MHGRELEPRHAAGGGAVAIDRSISRDRVTLAGVAFWIAGTLVGAVASADPIRLLGASSAIVGVTVWLLGALRLGLERRRAGVRTPLTAVPVLVAGAAGAIASVLLGVAVLAAWTLR